jgi:hypothetical protein
LLALSAVLSVGLRLLARAILVFRRDCANPDKADLVAVVQQA